jgi:hypothetical protein
VQRFRFSPRHPITHVGFTADGEIVTAQPHTGVAVRDRSSGEVRAKLDAPNSASFSHLLPHPTRPLVAVQCPKWCRVFDTRTGSFDTFDSHPGFAAVAVTPNGFRWFGVGYDGIGTVDCGIVTATGGTGTRRIPIRSTAALVAVTPDARFGLGLRRATRPVLLDLNTGRVVAEVQSGLRAGRPRLVVASPDSSKLAVGTGDSLAVFDLTAVTADDCPADAAEDEPARKRKVLYPLFTLERPDPVAGRGTAADRAAEVWLPPLAFDPAGRTLLTVGLRNRVRQIDAANGGAITEWAWRADAVRSLAVAPDGLTAAAGCRLGELLVWDLE